LNLIQYALNKDIKLDDNTVDRIAYVNWGIEFSVNEISVLYYFDHIAPNPEFFKPELSYRPDITSTLANYISQPNPDISIIRNLYTRGIDKQKFFESVYPDMEIEELGPDVLLPCYGTEKILFELMPDEIHSYSGHTLLHAAIHNLDIPLVQEIVYKNKEELAVKTKPKPPYFIDYGKKQFTPLELALYTYNYCERKVKEDPEILSYQLCLDQIKEIVVFLKEATGTELEQVR
jgi:hypothetical protein